MSGGAVRTAGGAALLLPGPGSQFVGMGEELAGRYPRAREVWGEAEERLGVPLRRICWEGPAEELTRTENAQPALLTHSYAVWRALPEPVRNSAVVAAGHSLGEFTAYLLAGALSFGDALRVVRRRGELMGEFGGEGTMAAVLGLEDEEVAAACEAVASGERSPGPVVAANFNAPGQVVISGAITAVREAGDRALEAGARRVLPLEVSGAFHSPLMEGAREGLELALGTVEWRPLRFPVVANVSAAPVRDSGTAPELLSRQLTAPVRWADSVRAMRRFEPDRWLELGPGNVLTGLLRRIDRGLEGTAIGGPGQIEELYERSGSDG